MPDDDVLADGWEWRGYGKVKKSRKHYIRVDGSNFKYVGVGRGDHTLVCSGGCPYLKLAALTHHDNEIQSAIKRRKNDIRRGIG